MPSGATLVFLPPYSSDFDLIEQVFAKIKHIMRKLARRTMEGLWNGFAIAIKDFTPNERLNYLPHAGYGYA